MMRSLSTKQPINDVAKPKNGERGRSRSISPLSTGMPLLQRKCACGGGCPRCKEELGIQTKLKISEPGDKYEQEADRIADEVMRMPEPSVQRQLEPEEEEDEMVQRKRTLNPTSLNSEQSPSEVPSIVSEVLNSPGQPLDLETRTFMESRLGHDFRQVRVHSDSNSAASAYTLNSRAYTVGKNIVFGTEQYAPTTLQGQWLLAHELTHVIQQTNERTTQGYIQRLPCNETNHFTSVQHEIIQRWYKLRFPQYQLLREYEIPQGRSRRSSYADLVSPVTNEIEEIIHPSEIGREIDLDPSDPGFRGRVDDPDWYVRNANIHCEPRQWRRGQTLPAQVIPHPRDPLFIVTREAPGILKYHYADRNPDRRPRRYQRALEYLRNPSRRGSLESESEVRPGQTITIPGEREQESESEIRPGQTSAIPGERGQRPNLVVIPGGSRPTSEPEESIPEQAAAAREITPIQQIISFIQQIIESGADLEEAAQEFLREHQEIVDFLIGGAIVFIIGTILEDIATLGIGLADDPLIISICVRLIQISRNIRSAGFVTTSATL